MNSSKSNDPLSQALAAWRVQPKADPNFRPAVWQRLKARTGQTWSAYLQARLAAWCLFAAVTAGVAGWAGLAAGRARLSAERDAIAVRYLVELDPRVQAKLRH